MHKTNACLIFLSVSLVSHFLYAVDQFICSLCEMRFDDTAAVLEHQHRHALPEFQALHDDSNKVQDFYFDSAVKCLQQPASYTHLSHSLHRLKMNFKKQTIVFGLDECGKHKKLTLDNMGAHMLLWAVKHKEAKAIWTLLENPNNLANLTVTDDKGRNALMLAESQIENMTNTDDAYEEWAGIVTKLQEIFRYFPHTERVAKTQAVADFNWRNPRLACLAKEPVIIGEGLYHYAEMNGLCESWQGKCQ